ncbi:MAG: putative 4-hydroxybenzoate polyprenyltransferase [Desulfovibrionaceae bacterium]|nr:putative 4-hydroxybenzoate polyprenyltransferase [Desulfovibrionaceae bacterium]
MNRIWRDAAAVCRMIKIEHSVFALPFAYAGAWLAARGRPGLENLLLLTLAMVAVRSFAMTCNRLLDLRYDRLNPRTQSRPLVSGELGVGFCLGFCLAAALVFVLACAGMNRLCLGLAVPALAWSGLYSLTKRFTWACHFVLGSVLGLAPLAGWICVDPRFTLPAVLYFCGVALWVAGFDILYACQDADFDRDQGLESIPARFGLEPALAVSSMVHVLAAVFFFLAGWGAGLGAAYFLVTGAVAVILVWEHGLISARDLSRVNTAFFTLNGVIAVFLFAGVWLDLFLSG